jgi:hypothetical protein
MGEVNFTIAHHPPKEPGHKGMFVVQKPGPAFDLQYERDYLRYEGRWVWKLELRSKPGDEALRALADACAVAALEADARLEGTGRVADLLADQRYADVRELGRRPDASETEVELPASAIPSELVRISLEHVKELELRGGAPEEHRTVMSPGGTFRFTADLSSVLLFLQPRGPINGSLRPTVTWRATLDRASIAALAAGSTASLRATERRVPTTEGSERAFIERRLVEMTRKKKTLALADGLAGVEKTRAIRSLARALHPGLVAAAYLDGEARTERVRETLSVAAAHPAVVSIDEPAVLALVRSGANDPLVPKPLEGEPCEVDVPDVLRRFCALFVWPPSRDVSWRGVRMSPLRSSSGVTLQWVEPAEAGEPGSTYRSRADLATMRRIGAGEITRISARIALRASR